MYCVYIQGMCLFVGGGLLVEDASKCLNLYHDVLHNMYSICLFEMFCSSTPLSKWNGWT